MIIPMLLQLGSGYMISYYFVTICDYHVHTIMFIRE